MRSSRKPRPIDRLVPGVGRLTIRTTRLTGEARNELDRYITRAISGGEIEQLGLLKERRVTVHEFLAAARRNRLPALRPQPAVRPLVDQWLKASDLRGSSRVRYLQSWKFMFNALPADATLDALTDRWWEDFAADRGVGNATLNRDRAALLAFRTWAQRRDLTLPVFKTERRVEEPKRSEILTPEQVDAVRRHCRSDRWPFFWTLLETGSRQGEALNLVGADVIRRPPALTFQSRPGSKGRGHFRQVPVSSELIACLETLAVLNGGGRLFPCSRKTVQEWWAQICSSAGITGVTLHGIRATFVTRGLDAGETGVFVQKLVGHSSLAMTERYYRNTEQDLAAASRIRTAIGIASCKPNEGAVPAFVTAAP